MEGEYIFGIYGSITSYYNSRDYVKYFMDKAGGKPIRVKVNSLGGDVNQALAIANEFETHGNVTVEFIGFNASAATFIAFGAKRIEMHEDSMWLAHHCSIPVDIWGNLNKEELKLKIEELKGKEKSVDAIDLMIASKYMNRSGKNLKEIFSLMDENRWMSASEAIEWKFADVLIPSKNKKPVITDEITDSFSAMGLPIPVILSEVEDNSEKGIITHLFQELRKTFVSQKELSHSNNNHSTPPLMRKEFVSIHTALNLEGLTEENGKVTLSLDQIKLLNEKIESAIKDKTDAQTACQNALKDKTTAETALSSVVTSLDSLSDEVKNATDVTAKVEVIKNILEKIPGFIPDVTGKKGEKTNFNDIAKDEINNATEY
jgi:ATP-dependent protease ClpP protease subunit